MTTQKSQKEPMAKHVNRSNNINTGNCNLHHLVSPEHPTRRTGMEIPFDEKNDRKGDSHPNVGKRKRNFPEWPDDVNQIDITQSKSTSTHSSASRVSKSNKHPKFSKEDHRAFVGAIFDIGLKESSPLSVMHHMSSRSKVVHRGLNLERIKSKLQKYRKKKKTSKDEFMGLYDDTLTDFSSMLVLPEGCHQSKQTSFLPPIQSLTSSEIAAYLTFSVMNEKLLPRNREENTKVAAVNQSLTPNKSNRRKHNEKTNNRNNSFQDNKLPSDAGNNKNVDSRLIIPVLTEAERNSPIGRSLVLFMELFKSVEKDLYNSRSNDQKQQDTEHKKVSFQDQGIEDNRTRVSHLKEAEKPHQPEQSVAKPVLNDEILNTFDPPASPGIFQEQSPHTSLPGSNSFDTVQSHLFSRSSSTQRPYEPSTESLQPPKGIHQENNTSTSMSTTHLPRLSLDYDNYSHHHIPEHYLHQPRLYEYAEDIITTLNEP